MDDDKLNLQSIKIVKKEKTMQDTLKLQMQLVRSIGVLTSLQHEICKSKTNLIDMAIFYDEDLYIEVVFSSHWDIDGDQYEDALNSKQVQEIFRKRYLIIDGEEVSIENVILWFKRNLKI